MNKSTVSKSELKNIKNFTRPALASISNIEEITGKTLEVLVPEVTDALKAYGCRNQAMVVGVVSALAPVAGEFFENFARFVEASENCSMESLKALLDYLEKEKDMPPEMKMEFYREFNMADEKRRKMILAILVIVAVSGCSAFLLYYFTKSKFAAKTASIAAITGLAPKLLKAGDSKVAFAILKALV